MDLGDLQIFQRVVELGSLSAAAREIDAPVSQISRALARLEARHKARLLHRNTHSLSLTEAGQSLLDHGRHMLARLADLEADLSSSKTDISGLVRIGVSPAMAQYVVVPSLRLLAKQHPQLRVELHVEDRAVDIAQQGLDFVIRTGTPTADNLVARVIGMHERRLYASPAYLKQHGRPKRPEDLETHRIIANSVVPSFNRWPFIVEGKPKVIQPRAFYRASSSCTMISMALQGLGIMRGNTVICDPLVKGAQLVYVLDEWVQSESVPINAIMLQERHRAPKVRTCIDFFCGMACKRENEGMTNQLNWRFLFSHPAHFVALGAGSGLSPVAPGTAGTLFAWASIGVLQTWLDFSQVGWLIACATLMGVWAAKVTAEHLGVADPSAVVIDEIVAFWLILWLMMPMTFWGQLAAFGLFRYFDAAKPGPVKWADQTFKGFGWMGGFGIVFDDLVAAFCVLLLFAAYRFWCL